MKIRVGIYDLEIVEVHGLADDNRLPEDGKLDLDKSVIFLNDDLGGVSRKETLWHEVFHAIFIQSGWKKLDEDTPPEEVMMELLAHGVMQVLKDNPYMRVIE